MASCISVLSSPLMDMVCRFPFYAPLRVWYCFSAYFAPAIIQSLGHGTIQTQLLSVPPWAAAFGLSMFTAIVSDYTKHRYIFTLLPTLLGMTGFIILLCVHHNNHLQYAALFLAASGVYSAMPIIVCWFNTNCKCWIKPNLVYACSLTTYRTCSGWS